MAGCPFGWPGTGGWISFAAVCRAPLCQVYLQLGPIGPGANGRAIADLVVSYIGTRVL